MNTLRFVTLCSFAGATVALYVGFLTLAAVVELIVLLYQGMF
jgi:hypothetical protein